MNRILLAEALSQSPAGTRYRDLITAANEFGFINGNYASDTLSLTVLGERLTRPHSEEEHLNALRQGMEKIPLFARLLGHFDNSRLPSTELLKSMLERPPFSVPGEWSTEGAQLFIAAGRLTGMIRDVSGNAFVLREAGRPVVTGEASEPDGNHIEDREPAAQKPNLRRHQPLQPRRPSCRHLCLHRIVSSSSPTVVIARHWLSLQSILKDLDIPFVVAEEEANAGRPISQKIADLMRSCSAGIFIFSGDEQVTDPGGTSVLRPRPNVVYELGAASFQYGRRIVIFKERGVEFPTDFRDLGYIEFRERSSLGKVHGIAP